MKTARLEYWPRVVILLSLLLLVSSGRVQAQVAEATDPAPKEGATMDPTTPLTVLLHQAGEAYQRGDYPVAAQGYEAVLARGLHNGHVLYNLGNAWYRQGRLGEAVLAWRRAAIFLPRDGDVEANLGYARAKARDKLEAYEPSWGQRVFFWYDRVSPRELLFALGGLNLLFWSALGLRLAGRSSTVLRPVLWVSAVGVLLAGGTLVARGWQLSQSPDAVVLADEVTVRSGTDVSSVSLFVLHAGAEVRTGGQSNGWVRVDLPNGKKGWLEARFVGLVSP